MKSASAPLIALLNSSTELAMADLFQFTIPGGLVVRYTSWDFPVTLNGTTWPVGPLIQRSGISWKVGVEVDTLKVTVNDDGSNAINSVPILQFLAAGGMDGARLLVQRAFGSKPGSWTDSVLLFSGRVSDIQISRATAEINVKSELALLDAQVPRNLFQSRCLNVLFDKTCGVNQASYAASFSVSSAVGGNPSVFSVGVGPSNDYYDQGYVVFTSGANNGIRRSVKQQLSGTFTLIQPLPEPLAAGDTLTAYPGCDGGLSTCTNKFANPGRYRGFPFIPVAETVL